MRPRLDRLVLALAGIAITGCTAYLVMFIVVRGQA